MRLPENFEGRGRETRFYDIKQESPGIKHQILNPKY